MRGERTRARKYTLGEEEIGRDHRAADSRKSDKPSEREERFLTLSPFFLYFYSSSFC